MSMYVKVKMLQFIKIQIGIVKSCYCSLWIKKGQNIYLQKGTLLACRGVRYLTKRRLRGVYLQEIKIVKITFY